MDLSSADTIAIDIVPLVPEHIVFESSVNTNINSNTQPKPIVDNLPEALIVAKSAILASREPIAAQPP